MAIARWAALPGRGVVAVTGPEAEPFLQNLVTADIPAVRSGDGAGYGALLAPQGKILFDFLILAEGDGFLLDLPRGMAPDLARRLGFYRLRARVDVADLSGIRAVAAAWGGGAAPAVPGTVAADPRWPALGWRAVLAEGAATAAPPGFAPAGEADCDAHRIAEAIPEGGRDFAYGDAFPHDAGLDQLGGVGFRKGCFVGQEVVSRMEHRGIARRRMVRVEAPGPLPAAGTPVEAAGRPLGTLGSSAGGTGIALLRLDRAREAIDGGTAITAGGTAITVALPAWARFGWPAAGAMAD